MSASTDKPERMAEILREIITLCGRKGADVRTALVNATENTHWPENSALEVRNQKSGPENYSKRKALSGSVLSARLVHDFCSKLARGTAKLHRSCTR
jgi:hypothetical protein